jgi:hypothetical protein
VPSSTDPTVAPAATSRLVPSEWISSLSSKNASYHWSDQPSKTASDFRSLKENTTTATIGA